MQYCQLLKYIVCKQGQMNHPLVVYEQILIFLHPFLLQPWVTLVRCVFATMMYNKRKTDSKNLQGLKMRHTNLVYSSTVKTFNFSAFVLGFVKMYML